MTISATLLHPGNRLLNGGTSDFAMFGGQPTVVAIAPPAADTAGYVAAFTPLDGGDAGDSRQALDNSPAPLYTGASAVDGIGVESGSAQSFLSTPVAMPAPMLPASQAAIEPLVPNPTGAGSLAPLAPVLPGIAGADPAAASGAPAAANPFQPPTLDVVSAQLPANDIALAAGLAAASLAPVAAIVDSTVPIATGTVQAIVPPIADAATQATETVVAGLTDTVATVGDAAADALTTVGSATQAVSASAAETVGTTTDLLAGTAAAATDQLSATTDQLSATTAQLAATTETLVTGTATAAAATLDGATAAVGDVVTSTVPAATDQLAATVETVAATAPAATTGVVDQAEATASQTVDSVAAITIPLVDHLASGVDEGASEVTDVLAGSDPAGGIQTLTAMVGASDVFEVAGDTIGVPIDAGASALDAVPADADAAGGLLGSDHGVDDLLHHGDGHGIGPL